MLRNPEKIKVYHEDIYALSMGGRQDMADQQEKYLACDLVPEGWRFEQSRCEGEEGSHKNYPFHHQCIMIAVPEDVPSLCNKKGLVLKGAPVKIWERESLSWRDIPAGEGSSKLQAVVAVETPKKLERTMADRLRGI